jgi:hypothetical protein
VGRIANPSYFRFLNSSYQRFVGRIANPSYFRFLNSSYQCSWDGLAIRRFPFFLDSSYQCFVGRIGNPSYSSNFQPSDSHDGRTHLRK